MGSQGIWKLQLYYYYHHLEGQTLERALLWTPKRCAKMRKQQELLKYIQEAPKTGWTNQINGQ